MRLKEFRTLNFRNLESVKLELPKEGALFVGRNGSGKTNLLEAFSFLLLGRSVRGVKPKQMINIEQNESFIEGSFWNNKNSKQSVGISKGGKVNINKDGDKSSRLSSLYGDNRFIYFGPNDIDIITGSPKSKRQFVDSILSQTDCDYLIKLMQYKSTISQRNRALNGSIDTVLIDIYDKQLSELGVYISNSREIYISQIKSKFREIYAEMGQDDIKVDLSYEPSILKPTVDDYYFALKKSFKRDEQLKFTTLGIHRDSYNIYANKLDIVGFGSQGQCRSASLALKASTIDFLTTKNKSDVIIAIDDAFSDLDSNRKKRFYNFVLERGQVFLALHSAEEMENFSLTPFFIDNGVVSVV